MKSEDDIRRERVSVILGRLQDLIEEDPLSVAGDLASAIFPILAMKYPADSSKAYRDAIKKAYPSATPALIKERALGPEGVLFAMAISSMIASIALDYTPEASASEHLEKDMAPDNSAGRPAAAIAKKAYDDMLAVGLSPFGVSSTMAITAVLEGIRAGLNPYLAARPMHEAMSLAFGNRGGSDEPMSEKEREERALKAVCEKMGISRAEGMKYVRAAKELMKKEEG